MCACTHKYCEPVYTCAGVCQVCGGKRLTLGVFCSCSPCLFVGEELKPFCSLATESVPGTGLLTRLGWLIIELLGPSWSPSAWLCRENWRSNSGLCAWTAQRQFPHQSPSLLVYSSPRMAFVLRWSLAMYPWMSLAVQLRLDSDAILLPPMYT